MMEDFSNQRRPRVSVIIPAYNHEKFVAKAIESVLQQTFHEFEIIITDDGSSDNTARIIEEFTDPRIRFFAFEKNRGACVVANIALKQVQGEYVSILSSDDLFLPQKLDTQVRLLDQHPEYGAVFSNAQLIDENGEPFEDTSHPYTTLFHQPNRSRFEWLRHFFYTENCLCHPTILIRAECYREIGGFNEGYAQLPDFEFWVRLCQHYEIHILPEKLIQFRMLSQDRNASGARPEVISRASWEHRHVLECFLEIDPSDFTLVFPEYEGPQVLTRDDVAYQLARLALKGNVHHGFAIDVLYELQRRGAQTASDFSPSDLIRLTGKYGNVYTARISELEKTARRVRELEQYSRGLDRLVQQQTGTIRSLEDKIHSLENQIHSIYHSTSWRLTRPVRWLSGKVKGLKQNSSLHLPSVPQKTLCPLVSMGLCIEKECDKVLAEITLKSIWTQGYSNWQLVLLYRGSRDEEIYSIINNFSGGNNQVMLIEDECKKESESPIDQLFENAAGEYFLWLSVGDKLHETAIDRFIDQLNITPEAAIIYSDEACFDENGSISQKHYKPDWNPDLFLSTPYFENGTLVRTDLLKQVGGFDDSFGLSINYEALLRCTEISDQSGICHIPEILYLRHVSIDRQRNAALRQEQDIRALRSTLKKREIAAEVTLGEAPLTYRVRYQLPDNPPRVTIIILTRNYHDLLCRCIDSILSQTTYPNYEILIIDNGSDEQNALDYMETLSQENKATIIKDERPFNFSALSNLAAGYAHGDLIAMLNNDTEVINDDWLEEMVSQALQPGVGAVGARLWYPDKTLQHGGVIFVKGLAGHAHRFLPMGESGYFGRAVAVQNFSAVTAACLVMRKDIFEDIGGMNENELSVAYNDIDMCLRLTEAGYRIVWTPYAELYHHESASRGDDREARHRKRAVREYKYMTKNWGSVLGRDPAYNINLPQDREDFFPKGFLSSDKETRQK